MSRESRLPAGGANLFQSIKAKCAEAEAGGQTLHKLSIGQPSGPALLPAREVAVEAIMSDAEPMHEYQDNGSPGLPSFAERFINAHTQANIIGLVATGKVKCLPTPGTKPMLGLIPLACNAAGEKIRVYTMPGYPTPTDWCRYLGVDHKYFILNPENIFRFDPNVLHNGTDLIMLNYPHNPSGQIATREWWIQICKKAVEENIRVFNDAAYSILAHSPDHCTLTDVAVDFPELSWAEAFSASKAGNFTGWRIGAIVGSPDFVGDIATIKGNTDSGFNAALAAGVLVLFEEHRELIDQVRKTYEERINLLTIILTNYGMQLAVKPKAGFFTLWKTPTRAFGEVVKNAEHFNFMMIEKTGVVGVHFHPFIRYAVCGDVKAMMEPIADAFRRADISYK
ncbi:MAG: aminotransferase class I/II-fold pyridoxal phosphate-dependent enzyme [Patescibacteria group bacterium]